MKEWPSHIIDLVDRIADARRQARDSGPRVSNDHLEGAIFVAMVRALDDFNQQQAAAATEPPAEPVAEASAEVVTDVEPSPDEPAEPTDADLEPEPEPEPEEPSDEPTSRRRRRS